MFGASPIWFFDVSTGKKLGVADCDFGGINPLVHYSPDSKLLACCFQFVNQQFQTSQTIFFWNATTHQRLPLTWKLDAPCNEFFFSDDGKYIILEHTVLTNEKEFAEKPRRHGLIERFRTWTELWQVDPPKRLKQIGFELQDSLGRPGSAMGAAGIQANGSFRVTLTPGGVPIVLPRPMTVDVSFSAKRSVAITDLATGRELLQYKAEDPLLAPFQRLTIAFDFRAVAITTGGETRILDLAHVKNKLLDLEHIDPDWQYLWNALADENVRKANIANAKLLSKPAETCAFIKRRLPAIDRRAPEFWARLLNDLNDAKYPVREQAQRKWEELGPSAMPILSAARKAENTTLEQRARIERLLQSLAKAENPAEFLRPARAVYLLERIATPDAISVLASIADGEPAAWLTVEAQSALSRQRLLLPPGSNQHRD
jgi:hypothetical protein